MEEGSHWQRKLLPVDEEIRARPFVRLLAWWIAGIVCQHSFSSGWGGFVVLAVVLIVLLAGNSTAGESRMYAHRWQWGAVYAALTVLTGMAVSEMAERRSLYPRQEPCVIMAIAEQSQQRLVEKIDRLSLTDGEKSVLAALTVGYKKALPREVRKRFAVSGVAHILSVSGFHVAVAYSFVSLLLGLLFPRRFPLRILRWAVTVGAVWVFVAVSGMAAASIRAGCMLTVYLTGKYLVRRRTDSYNTLAATAFFMLACHPAYLFDIGFQLSFIAVFSILYLQPPLRDLIDVKNPLLAKPWGWVTVSIAAQVGTAFLCAYYFGYFSLTFLFTNVPVILFASLLIPAALVWLLLPVGDGMLQRVVEELTHYLVYTADLFGTLSWAAYPFRFTLVGVIAAYAAMGGILLAVAIRQRQLQR
jgi:competence protein ComEC